jgi:hypothetical protein
MRKISEEIPTTQQLVEIIENVFRGYGQGITNTCSKKKMSGKTYCQYYSIPRRITLTSKYAKVVQRPLHMHIYKKNCGPHRTFPFDTVYGINNYLL